MAQIFNSAVMTDAGAALLARAQAGTAVLNFTAVVTGNGVHTDKTAAALKARTALLSQKQRFSISDKTIIENTSVKMTATLSNEGLTTGYYLNEIGLLCQDGDDASTATLFSIAVTAADHGDYFPAFSESGLVQIIQNFIISTSNTANITVAIGSDVYALASDLEAHEGLAVNSQGGAHGLRFYNDALQYFDETEQAWTDIKTGGGTTIVQLPEVTIGTYYYNGATQGPTISCDTENCIISGDYRASDVGEYHFTISLKDEGMVWSDLTTEPKSYHWSISTSTITIPSVYVGSYVYDGQEKGPAISGVDEDHVTVTGDKATNAGDYTLVFSLTDPVHTTWIDGTTADKTWAWSIAKAAGSITLSKYSIALNENNKTGAAVISDATGTISLSTSDSTVATAEISVNAVVVSSPNEKSGTATITVNVAESTNYLATSAQIAVTASFTVIYGVEWDGTSATKWSRTDAAENFTDPVPAVNNGTGSSPFDDIYPWSGMTKSERAGGTMVALPKFYYKATKSGKKLKLQVSEDQFDGSRISPVLTDRGDGVGERDVAYIGRYHCATSTYKSTTGVMPAGNYTRAQFRTSIHNLGSGIYQNDILVRITIWILYLVEFADWNSQATIGYGCGNNSATENAGATDAMQYHTGTSAANRTTYGHTQYRNIEDLWGNVYDWCDGIYFSGADVYAIKNPASFSDTTGGTKIMQRPTSGNYISEFNLSTVAGFEDFWYPSEVSGSESTYICDYCNYDASGVVLRVGGNYGQSQVHGLFYLNGSNAASSKNANIGSRLLELPSAA